RSKKAVQGNRNAPQTLEHGTVLALCCGAWCKVQKWLFPIKIPVRDTVLLPKPKSFTASLYVALENVIAICRDRICNDTVFCSLQEGSMGPLANGRVFFNPEAG